MPKTINMRECDYRLIKYKTKVLADHLEVQPTSLKNWVSLNVDWEGYPSSFRIADDYFASAQGYYDGVGPRGRTSAVRMLAEYVFMNFSLSFEDPYGSHNRLFKPTFTAMNEITLHGQELYTSL